jgi:hypothetical protein
MKIARYIGDLLFEYECIVIPGFGGFITKELPAKIHPVQNHFIPPSKEIVFNAHLKVNDGLLINHIASSEKINYAEARSRLEHFVERCNLALENGKKINFRKVGSIFLNKEGFKVFEADSTQNYLAESYGLKSFISPPIKRNIGGRPIQKKVTPDRKAEEVHRKTKVENRPKQKSNEPRYIRLNISAIIILIFISALVIFRFATVKEYYNNYSSLIPFFYTSPNDYFIENYEELGLEKAFNFGDQINFGNQLKDVGDKLNINYKLDEDKSEEVQAEETKPESLEETYEKLVNKLKEETQSLNTDGLIKEELVPETKVETVPKTKTAKTVEKKEAFPENKPESKLESNPKSPQYFIIAGSFNDMANADKYILELKQKGFEARLAGKNKFNQYRVCFNSYNNIKDASQQLAIIRKDESPSAWILSI